MKILAATLIKKNVIKYIIGINLFFDDTSAIHSANLIGTFFRIGLRKIIIVLLTFFSFNLSAQDTIKAAELFTIDGKTMFSENLKTY